MVYILGRVLCSDYNYICEEYLMTVENAHSIMTEYKVVKTVSSQFCLKSGMNAKNPNKNKTSKNACKVSKRLTIISSGYGIIWDCIFLFYILLFSKISTISIIFVIRNKQSVLASMKTVSEHWKQIPNEPMNIVQLNLLCK